MSVGAFIRPRSCIGECYGTVRRGALAPRRQHRRVQEDGVSHPVVHEVNVGTEGELSKDSRTAGRRSPESRWPFASLASAKAP